ncbi:hypothetical protein Dsin_020828 [Dipteronia sinensis]|uniref:DUF4218 domain-containing protein n=1 Tax=Dipteronia sinensis TaxID=43782 RepID=A0AAE0AAH0_9ROSI|nr:hypothetical protein Dsin_020828 [Dipteronia sinensis]
MVHLTVHLPSEAKYVGPVGLRWMYPIESKHRELLQREGNTNNVELRQQQLFPKWFESHIRQLRENWSLEATDELYSLSCGPDFRVRCHPGCVVNGILYLVTSRDEQRTTQNSGVMMPDEHDSNDISFYGVLISVVELVYLFSHQHRGLWDIQEKDVIEVQDEQQFYQQNESSDTVLMVQHDDIDSQLFHRDDVNADMIEDQILHKERMVTNENMDDFICDEVEEDQTIEDYYSDDETELVFDDDSDIDHNIWIQQSFFFSFFYFRFNNRRKYDTLKKFL